MFPPNIDTYLRFLIKSNWFFLYQLVLLCPRYRTDLISIERAERSTDVPTTRGHHLIGKEVGRYVLEHQLGYGGSSAVFLAQSLSTEEKVAVKAFLPRSTMDVQTQKNFYRRFLREAQAASELDHPHILSIYSYGQHEGLPYIIMPYMPGGTLSEYVAQYGPLR